MKQHGLCAGRLSTGVWFPRYVNDLVASKSTIKSDSRRLEARRKRSEERDVARRDRLRALNPGVISIWVAFYVLAVLVVLSGEETIPWRLNQRVEQSITARVDFSFTDTLRFDEDRRIARETAPDVYVKRADVFVQVPARVNGLLEAARVAEGDVAKVRSTPAVAELKLQEPAIQKLIEIAGDEAAQQQLAAAVTRVIDRLDDEYVVDEASTLTRRRSAPNAVLRDLGGRSPEVPTSQLIYVSQEPRIQELVKTHVAQANVPAELQSVLSRIILQSLTSTAADGTQKLLPIWRFDKQETNARMEAEQNKVNEKDYEITVKEGSELVQRGAQLTERHMLVLRPEHKSYLEQLKTDPGLRRQRMMENIGAGLWLLLLSLGLVYYLSAYQPRVLLKAARSFGLAGLLLLMVALARVIQRFEYPTDLPLEACILLIVFSAALLSISYDQRIALGIGVVMSLFITMGARADHDLFLTLIAPMAVTVFALKEVRTRSKIVGVGAVAGVVACLASTAVSLTNGYDITDSYVFVHAGVAGGSALLAGFIVQGILPLFERIFGVATSMTLLEWCDASKPLLRRLAQDAPGTYSHSLILSQMAEEAAQAIGARGLLTRVGALYHDIGKMQKPDYFVENQEARMNRHDRLSPTMSLLIIVGHVKDGMEMAKAYGVPRVLHQFIAEHHGTTVVRYFHHAASEQAAKNKGRHDREVSESEFRYPGPKPHTKESVILMLCDGCEGAVRALAEPSPGRIESTVHQVVMDRLSDGQFDEADITLREITQIETSLVKSLCAIHHGRIKYPKSSPPKSEKPAAASEDSSSEGERKSGAARSSSESTSRTPEVVRQS